MAKPLDTEITARTWIKLVTELQKVLRKGPIVNALEALIKHKAQLGEEEDHLVEAVEAMLDDVMLRVKYYREQMLVVSALDELLLLVQSYRNRLRELDLRVVEGDKPTLTVVSTNDTEEVA